jgi:tetratricopeptide (TPR) repeat protein
MGLEKAKLIQDVSLQARGWVGLADLHVERGDNRQGLMAAEQAEEFAQRLPKAEEGGERLELIRAVTLRGWALARLGDFDVALPVAERAMTLSNESGGVISQMTAMNLLAYLYDDVGRYQEGAYYHQKAIALARQNGDQAWETALLNNLGDSYMMMGNFEGAIKVFEEAFNLARTLGYTQLENLVLVNIAGSNLELENIPEAEACLRRAYEAVKESNPFYLSYCYSLLGRVCACRGDVEEGLSFARRGLQLAEELDNPEDIALAWHALADLAANHKERVVIIGRRSYTPADCFENSAGVFAENGQEIERARLLVKWAGYERSAGNTAKALSLIEEARSVFTRYDLPLFLSQTRNFIPGSQMI